VKPLFQKKKLTRGNGSASEIKSNIVENKESGPMKYKMTLRNIRKEQDIMLDELRILLSRVVRLIS